MKKYFFQNRGFTLTELLVTIGIIGILSAAIVPSLSRYLPSINLNGETKVLVATLREAQEKTITEQKQYLVRFSPSATPPYYEIIRINDTIEELVRQEKLKSGETLTLANTITNAQIIFSPDGGPSSNGDITLHSGSSSKIVEVTPAGFINIK